MSSSKGDLDASASTSSVHPNITIHDLSNDVLIIIFGHLSDGLDQINLVVSEHTSPTHISLLKSFNHDFYNLSLVCRSWNQPAQTALYRKVRLLTSSSFISFSETIQRSPKLLQLVRSVDFYLTTLTEPESLPDERSSSKTTTTGRFRNPPPPLPSWEDKLVSFEKIVTSCDRQILDITLFVEPSSISRISDSSDPNSSAVLRMADSISNLKLQRLSIIRLEDPSKLKPVSRIAVDAGFLTKLMKPANKITQLHLQNFRHYHSIYPTKPISSPSFVITQLTLSQWSLRSSQLEQILRTAPKVTSLSLVHSRIYASSEELLLRAFDSCCSKLKEFEMVQEDAGDSPIGIVPEPDIDSWSWNSDWTTKSEALPATREIKDITSRLVAKFDSLESLWLQGDFFGYGVVESIPNSLVSVTLLGSIARDSPTAWDGPVPDVDDVLMFPQGFDWPRTLRKLVTDRKSFKADLKEVMGRMKTRRIDFSLG